MSFLIITVLGYPGLTVSENVYMPGSALGFGLALPGMGWKYVRATLGATIVIFPVTANLLAIYFFKSCYSKVL